MAERDHTTSEGASSDEHPGETRRDEPSPAASGASPGNRLLDRLPAPLRADPVLAAVVAITALALIARLFALGARVFHWDEARVGYWILRAVETGDWRYRYIIHGPFVQHVDRLLFPLLGNSDFVARLPVAVVGSLLPLSALLFRGRLRAEETVGLALLLAANPILLYYSRFMRSDLLVATFAFVALGFVVRLVETRRARYLYLASGAFALAFASKENAVVYLVCWVGAVATVAGLELVVPRRADSRGALLSAARERLSGGADRLRSRGAAVAAAHLLAAVVLFGLVTLLLYAPRGSAGSGGASLWGSGPLAVVDATVDALAGGFDHWAGGDGPPGCGQYRDEASFVDKYVCNLGRELNIVRQGAAVLGVLSLIGFVSDQLRSAPRVLVAGAFYWGVASLLGYPLGSDITYPAWLTVHAIVPLAIPASVGVGLVVRWGRESIADGDRLDVALSALLAVALVTGMVVPAVHYSYGAPQSGPEGESGVVQFAQPAGLMQEDLRTIEGLGAEDDGVDVLVYGSSLTDMDQMAPRKPACMAWFDSLPLPWYLRRSNAAVECAENRTGLDAALDGARPPVIIADPVDASAVDERVGDEYAATTYELRLWGSEVRVYVHESLRESDG
jgi:uncharacterized protein (TIGR03663 family)